MKKTPYYEAKTHFQGFTWDICPQWEFFCQINDFLIFLRRRLFFTLFGTVHFLGLDMGTTQLCLSSLLFFCFALNNGYHCFFFSCLFCLALNDDGYHCCWSTLGERKQGSITAVLRQQSNDPYYYHYILQAS